MSTKRSFAGIFLVLVFGYFYMYSMKVDVFAFIELRRRIKTVAFTNSNSFLPVVYGDYATWLRNSSKCPSLPKRIHQTWKNELIPVAMKDAIASWNEIHPDYEYWFWTDELAEEFIAKRFPNYISMYRSYKLPIMRADAQRYFILYEFGGIYADLDMKVLRRLDDLVSVHTALIPQDHAVHRFIYWQVEDIPLNALMFSVPRHAFFRKVIKDLPKVNVETKSDDFLSKTGPFMLTREIREYNQTITNNSSVCDSVFLAPHYKFVPHFSELITNELRKSCTKIRIEYKNKEGMKWCKYLDKNSYRNPAKPLSTQYTVHQFANTYIRSIGSKTVHINHLVHKRFQLKQFLEQFYNSNGPDTTLFQ
ncbi:uncharacterized protein LOC141901166 [Tubulanus polymorphus]|uniref:uncharacterized protein LOC141901166 n=1 Tax=Tubulanus polymorphus TaxID=672921 RepID=UPI003DA66F51